MRVRNIEDEDYPTCPRSGREMFRNILPKNSFYQVRGLASICGGNLSNSSRKLMLFGEENTGSSYADL